MGDMLYCEWMKLKRSKIMLTGFLGTFIVPVFVVIRSIQRYFVTLNINDGTVPEMDKIWLFNLYDDALLFLMLIFAPLVMSVVAVYLISREYTEKTLKTVFTVPVSREKFLAGKLLMLFLLVMLFMFLSWLEILTAAIICGFFADVEIPAMTALTYLFIMMKGGILLYTITLPVFYLAMRTKGFIAPFCTMAVVCMMNVVLSASPIAGIYPWTAAYLLAAGRMQNTGISEKTAYCMIILVGVAAGSAGIIRFRREDVR